MSKNQKRLIKIIVATVIFIAITIIVNLVELEEYIILLMYLGCYLFSSYQIIIKAFKNILKGKVLDENFLMVIASIGAFFIKEYPEGLAVMLFYQVGELFESYAVKKSRKNIASLMDIRPDIATIVKDDQEEIVDPYEVSVNDVIVVRVGEKVPVDGIIIKGNSMLDTSSLTGEAIPKEVFENDEILSGSINIGSVIYIKVTKPYSESTVAKILELVENASNKKTKIENFITRFARYYTPIVVGLAFSISIFPPLFNDQWINWITKGITFLVVSCPCALVISVPLSFFGGLGASSKRGILIKGTTYLELINKANIFVFDKTGTITKGNFEVEKIYTNVDQKTFLETCYIAESKSNHPLAKSIVKYCEQQNIILNNNFNIEELAGYGIVAKNETTIILAGNSKLMERYMIDYLPTKEVGSVIYIVKDSVYLGYLLIKDQIKDDSKDAIKYLNNQKYQTIMLTGDKEEVAKEVAKSVNLTGYYSELLPHEKVKTLEEILNNKKENDVVAYLGDGINDAPALMVADVGISMGSIGSDSAIEASDIVLMYDKLSSIIEAKKIAKKTIRIVKQNIAFAIGIKILVLLLSLIGFSNIWLAVFADVGVSVIAILNAMRTMRIK